MGAITGASCSASRPAASHRRTKLEQVDDPVASHSARTARDHTATSRRHTLCANRTTATKLLDHCFNTVKHVLLLVIGQRRFEAKIIEVEETVTLQIFVEGIREIPKRKMQITHTLRHYSSRLRYPSSWNRLFCLSSIMESPCLF